MLAHVHVLASLVAYFSSKTITRLNTIHDMPELSNLRVRAGVVESRARVKGHSLTDIHGSTADPGGVFNSTVAETFYPFFHRVYAACPRFLPPELRFGPHPRSGIQAKFPLCLPEEKKLSLAPLVLSLYSPRRQQDLEALRLLDRKV